MLTPAEKAHFANEQPPVPDIDPVLVQLTCAALTGLFNTPMIGTPREFAIKAVAMARETLTELSTPRSDHA